MIYIQLFKKFYQKIEFSVEPSRNDVKLTINKMLIPVCFKIQIHIQYSMCFNISFRLIFVGHFFVMVVVKFLRCDYNKIQV